MRYVEIPHRTLAYSIFSLVGSGAVFRRTLINEMKQQNFVNTGDISPVIA